MERQGKSIKVLLASVTNAGERSSLFWWFVEHHDEIGHTAREQRIRWNALAHEVAELGLTNRLGVPATPKLTKLTWERARAFVAAQRRIVSGPGTDHHSRNRSMPSAPAARPIAAAVFSPQSEMATESFVPPLPPGLPDGAPARGLALGGWMAGDVTNALTPEEEARAERELDRMQSKLDRTDLHLNL